MAKTPVAVKTITQSKQFSRQLKNILSGSHLASMHWDWRHECKNRRQPMIAAPASSRRHNAGPVSALREPRRAGADHRTGRSTFRLGNPAASARLGPLSALQPQSASASAAAGTARTARAFIFRRLHFADQYTPQVWTLLQIGPLELTG